MLAPWKTLSVESSKIIGKRGFQSIYVRSLRRAQAEFPWLAAEPQDDEDTFIPLGMSLMQRSGAEAAAANATLLNSFLDTLVLLIGEQITERVLCAAWGEDPVNDFGPEREA